jgi:hypothetical protein
LRVNGPELLVRNIIQVECHIEMALHFGSGRHRNRNWMNSLSDFLTNPSAILAITEIDAA